MVVVLNFSSIQYDHYRFNVSENNGYYEEVINSDKDIYNGYSCTNNYQILIDVKQFLRYILTLVVVLLTTTPAWAGKAKINANSDPSEGGFVYVANSAGSYTPIKNSDDATQDGDFWSKQDKTFYTKLKGEGYYEKV